MQPIDYIIISVYLLLLVGFGVYLQKKASTGIDSFFLGNRKIPWWALGASGMASNLDVSGTMIIVALIYAIGLNGFFIEIRGGIVLVMAFFMIFMGKWNRRAGVMTLAEWMQFRFGPGRAGNIARLLAAITNLAFAVAVVTYFAQGGGIFLGTILGMDPNLAALIMIVLASIYTIASGLYGVVYTDVFQGFLILVAILYVCFLAFTQYTLPDEFMVSVPLVGGGFQELKTSITTWVDVVPSWNMNLPGEYAAYNFLGIAVMFYLAKTVIEGSGGSGGYLVQRYYAAENDREAGLLSLLWILLLSFRWPFVVSMAIIGIVYGSQHGVIQNPEEVLPTVLLNVIPTGMKGLLLAGLIAAAMSTFDSVVNSGAAYWVKDIYQKFIRPDADEKKLIWHSRVASLVIVVVGLALTYAFNNLNQVWSWLTMGLGSGFIIPQVIRWYWWRFNGWGFASGVFTGMVMAFAQLIFYPGIGDMWGFLIITSASFVASILGTFMSDPVDDEVLVNFYRKTRPFGFWGHIRDLAKDVDLKEVDAENKRDIRSIFIAVPWQLTLFMTPMVLVTRQWHLFWPLFGLLIVLSLLLYFGWFRHLSARPRASVVGSPHDVKLT
jgi:solute:Na+ symporter, SSS family